MDYEFIPGGILACSLALVFGLYRFAEKRKATNPSSMHVKSSNGCAKTTSENGICPQNGEGSTDIIIVGAGVAGAALAYTLGKV